MVAELDRQAAASDAYVIPSLILADLDACIDYALRIEAAGLRVLELNIGAPHGPEAARGAIVTEQIFRVPGIGSLLISAMLANDTPVVMAVTFVFACLVIFFNFLADILYAWLDPRIAFR